MKFRKWKHILRDGAELHMYEWKPDNDKKIKGIIQQFMVVQSILFVMMILPNF